MIDLTAIVAHHQDGAGTSRLTLTVQDISED